MTALPTPEELAARVVGLDNPGRRMTGAVARAIRADRETIAAALREEARDLAQSHARANALREFADRLAPPTPERPSAETVRALGADTPWPLADVLRELADAADHLLGHHSCDAHGHEMVGAARDAARAFLARLTPEELATRQLSTDAAPACSRV